MILSKANASVLSIEEIENIEYVLSILSNSKAQYDNGKLIVECNRRTPAGLLNDIQSIDKTFTDISVDISNNSNTYTLSNHKVNYSVNYQGVVKRFDRIIHFKKYLSILFDKGDA